MEKPACDHVIKEHIIMHTWWGGDIKVVQETLMLLFYNFSVFDF